MNDLLTVGEVAAGMYRRDIEEHEDYMAYLDSYTGAKPLGRHKDDELYPFEWFPLWHRREIAAAVFDERPPPQWLEFEFCEMESRAWYEWHWHRGLNPRKSRSTKTKLRLAVIERDGFVCGLCGGDVEPDDVHIDHIQPVSLGGSDDLENLQVSHSLCNLRKGNRV